MPLRSAKSARTMTRIELGDLRRYAVARSFFEPTTLGRALAKLGYVQADPIRAPARAQDLTLRQRVKNYRAGDLERRYPELDIEEDFFVNYGFVLKKHHRLMHPRVATKPWDRATKKRAAAVLEFVRERGRVHPRDVEERFAHGKVTNYWGGSSNATTHLLDGMHYRGLLRVVRRDRGIRVYSVEEPSEPVRDPAVRRARVDALVDVAVGLHAPLPGKSLAALVSRLRYATPQWAGELESALARAEKRLAHAVVDGMDWYWPARERFDAGGATFDRVRLLAPFDPLVWDRFRFERIWGWRYRFEAYTPVSKRKLGYYALPLLWREHVIGWANVRWEAGELDCNLGFVTRRPVRDGFEHALEAELSAMKRFLAGG
jgi:uncharacterized protein YcaQ